MTQTGGGSQGAGPRSGRLALLFVLWTGLQAFPLSAQASKGPLATSEQNPLYRLFYVPDAESADILSEGTIRLEFSTSYSSIFEASNRTRHAHLFDLEQMTNALAIRYGLSPSVEVAGRVGLYTGWEGFLDPVISGFHNFFGLPNGGREHQPEGQYLLLMLHDDLEGGEVDLDAEKRTLSLEDVRLFLKWRLLGEIESPRSMSLHAGLRVAGGPLDAGRVDGAISLLGRISSGSFHFHGSAGLIAMNPPSDLNPIAARGALALSGAAEYARWSSVSLLAQLSVSSNYLRHIKGGELDGLPLNLIVGMAGLAGEDWRWQVSFAEDLYPNGPAIDFTVDFELSRAFRLE